MGFLSVFFDLDCDHDPPLTGAQIVSLSLSLSFTNKQQACQKRTLWSLLSTAATGKKKKREEKEEDGLFVCPQNLDPHQKKKNSETSPATSSNSA